MEVWFGHECGKRAHQDIHMAKRREWPEKGMSLF